MKTDEPELPAAALRPGDELVGWIDDRTDVPLRVVEAAGTRVTIATAAGAVPSDQLLHVSVRRGVRLAVAFTVTARRPATDAATGEVLELGLQRVVDLSARRDARRDEGGRAVRLQASAADVRPATPVRLLDRSASGVRIGAADTLRPGDRVVLRDREQLLDVVVVRRLARAFGRAEYGCTVVTGETDAAAAV